MSALQRNLDLQRMSYLQTSKNYCWPAFLIFKLKNTDLCILIINNYFQNDLEIPLTS